LHESICLAFVGQKLSTYSRNTYWDLFRFHFFMSFTD